MIASKAATRGVLKKPALKILQIAQENICVGVSRPWTLLKRDSNTSVFPWNLKIFNKIYFEEHLQKAASVAYTKGLRV